MKIAPINKGFLLIGVTLTFFFIIITYIPWEHSNYNGLPDSILEIILIKVFEFLTFLPQYATDKFFPKDFNLIIYLIINLLNLFIYGLFIERIITFFIERIKSK